MSQNLTGLKKRFTVHLLTRARGAGKSPKIKNKFEKKSVLVLGVQLLKFGVSCSFIFLGGGGGGI